MESYQGTRTYSVVIPNRFEDIIKPLLESIKRYEQHPTVIIVADRHDRSYGYKKVKLSGQFSFAKAANTGIRAARQDDIILMNDDSRLVMPTFNILNNIAYSDPKIGILTPMIDGGCGNLFMRADRTDLWSNRPDLHFCNGRGGDRVTFACVYLKHDFLNSIGLFDEGFIHYGYDDADMCIRAVKGGWKVAITNKLVVRHGEGGSKFVRGKNWNTSFKRTHGEDYRASLPYIRAKHPDYVV